MIYGLSREKERAKRFKFDKATKKINFLTIKNMLQKMHLDFL